MKINTDRQKCLQALQDAGSKGVHSFNLGHIVGSIRVAARIRELREEGYTITSKFETLGNATGVRYTLHSAPLQKKESNPVRISYKFVGNTAIPVKI